jgi:hypothetical protein
MKKHAARRPRVSERFLSERNYFFSGALAAGFASSFLSSIFGALAAGALVAGALVAGFGALAAGALVIGLLAAAGVEGAAGLLAGFAGALFAVLVPASPQAAPRRPIVKTAERAITFFISINSPVFFKEYMFTLLFNDLPKKVVFLKPNFLEHSTI